MNPVRVGAHDAIQQPRPGSHSVEARCSTGPQSQRLVKGGSLQPLWTQHDALDTTKAKKKRKPVSGAAADAGPDAAKKLRLSKQRQSQFLKRHQ